MRYRIWAAVAAFGVLGGALTLATPGYAHHNLPTHDIQLGDCGELTFSTAWPEDTHVVESTVLVVQVAGEQHTAPIGTDLTIGPFDSAQEQVRWRIWGGGERDYDQPPLDDLDALLAHLEAGGGVLDPDAPGVAWHELSVDGCPKPSPTPSPEPSPTPGEENGTGGEELPKTSGLRLLPVLGGVGAGLFCAGALALGLARRRRHTFTA